MTADPPQFAHGRVVNDDLNLVHATQNGDVSAFEQLVKRYDRKLLRIAQGVTHNAQDAQDAVQEAFWKAFQNLAEFRAESQFSTWLIRITLNQSLMKLRKQRATKEVSLDDDFQADGDILPMEVADWASNPEQLYQASEFRDILLKAISELRPLLRAVFVLRDIEGLSTEQTAEVLNLKQTTVKARLWRGRLQLRQQLTKHFGERNDFPPRGALPKATQTHRSPGIFAECLHTATPSTYLINACQLTARFPKHSVTEPLEYRLSSA
jgi:RNA polymerase sigma-70 factor (ECF subfamily)